MSEPDYPSVEDRLAFAEKHRAEPAEVQREDRTAHWGTCSNPSCLCSMIIYPHWDAEADLPDPDDDATEWDTSPFFLSCPVCGSSMDWGGTDHPADLLKNY